MLLKTFQSGDFELAQSMLDKPECLSTNLNAICDSDGKTLLHLACQKDWTNWGSIICNLIKKHNYHVSAVDEDGNTPLHEAYQCGNRSMLTYLLSLPACNPGAVNKHDYTVLRMALEKNDKVAVREVLATGRVDPRRGTSRGHTYRELLEMNSLQPTDREYDGSALQVVEEFAKCIDSNSNQQPPLVSLTEYCLLETLKKMSKNQDQISIRGLLEMIKENKLPLPEDPETVHDLLTRIKPFTMVDAQGRIEDRKILLKEFKDHTDVSEPQATILPLQSGVIMKAENLCDPNSYEAPLDIQGI